MSNVVLASCIYNEGWNIYNFLRCAERIRGLELIHLLDGPWNNAGYTSPLSTDRTKEEIKRYQRDNPDKKIVFDQEGVIYRTEGDKRNRQFDMIREKCGPETIILWMDGDEEIIPIEYPFINAQSIIDEKKLVCLPVRSLTCLQADCKCPSVPAPRVIPPGFHWHTDLVMRFDSDSGEFAYDFTLRSNVKINNELRARGLPGVACYDRCNRKFVSELKPAVTIINNYAQRPEERQKEKLVYCDYWKNLKDIPCKRCPR
jgi:glycosyltransferase involved in cell wall biosynthesis